MSEKKATRVPEQIVSGVLAAENILLVTHVHPDGDAYGSSLGLADILRSLGKNVCVFFEEPVSALYDFLPGSNEVTTEIKAAQNFFDSGSGDNLVIALDAGDSGRLGEPGEQLSELAPLIVIDHHKSHKNFGDCRWVEPTTSSTGEMIYELSQVLGVTLSHKASVNLYVAICTDTGSFRYESTQSRTLHIAADLVGNGVRPEKVARCLYDNISLPRLKLLQQVLGTLRLYEDGQLAFVHVTDEMIAASNASVEDIEGFVDYPRSLGSVKVAVFLKQINNDQVSVSMRAKGDCDVAEVASAFDGGGHCNAAGCRFPNKSLNDVHELVLGELRNRFRQ